MVYIPHPMINISCNKINRIDTLISFSDCLDIFRAQSRMLVSIYKDRLHSQKLSPEVLDFVYLI